MHVCYDAQRLSLSSSVTLKKLQVRTELLFLSRNTSERHLTQARRRVQRKVSRTIATTQGQWEGIVIGRGPIATRFNVRGIIVGGKVKVIDELSILVARTQRVGLNRARVLLHALERTFATGTDQTGSAVIDGTVTGVHVKGIGTELGKENVGDRVGRDLRNTDFGAVAFGILQTAGSARVNGTDERSHGGIVKT